MIVYVISYFSNFSVIFKYPAKVFSGTVIRKALFSSWNGSFSVPRNSGETAAAEETFAANGRFKTSSTGLGYGLDSGMKFTNKSAWEINS